ncbi:hypothetical protein DICPUDRAFT_158341 [Dictyostelium purpureum]|uniref:D-lactate dehydrogenase (cytochrome) n=1 Tax=Dictyostelium purpureum TaxID=5786 RepID=F1A1D2_DICPU|nr:uncharacterized protein DICPUDRAFT_158341 [Dictyostelium purpureum]EGC29997.1 hypothetical protein DICPUDRAFT_158341 [Dictyostelium purpureum]|eukprot:XP_003293481.1 hypothetical protein DICPUDRAFT_158341 [Dictyostelium purpureum]
MITKRLLNYSTRAVYKQSKSLNSLKSFTREYSQNNNSQNNNDQNKKKQNFFYSIVGVSAVGLGFCSLLNLDEKEKSIDVAKNNITTNETSKIPDEAAKELILIFSERFVTSTGDLEAHGKDFSYHERQCPDAIVYPHNQDEVIQLVNICRKYKIPIIPYGSGTSLEGHTIATHGGLTVDFRNMSRVLDIHKDDFYVTVQPGISYGDLNEELKKIGFFFPVDPGPGASIGGMVGTSCSGTYAVHYGTMKENVLSMKVVLPNGDLVTTRSKAKKSSAGYDLTHLFIGSEGTLGVVTEVTLKIVPIPECSQVSLVTFDDISSASQSVIKTMQSGLHIGRVELLDDVMMKAVNIASGTKYSEKPTLIFEFFGSEEMVREITKQERSLDFQFSSTPEEKETLWMARKVALWSSKVLKPNSEVWITDVCVPISKLARIIDETKVDIATTSLLAPLVAHAGDGNFHLFILFDPNNQKELSEAKFINDSLVKRAIGYDGTCTGEHGVSFGKIKYLEKELSPESVGLMKTIKKSIDPLNIMNPGKIITVEEFNKN